MPASDANRDRLIVALDVATLDDALGLLDRLQGVVTHVKIGSQLSAAAGLGAVEAAHKRGFEVFLDLKFHDIPNTVAGAAREATRLGVFMYTVHASGGRAMMRAAASGAAAAARELGLRRPLGVAVTVLTSLDRRALHDELGVATSVEGHVLHLSRLAQESGLDGCVASPREIAPIRRLLGPHWPIVTPGIRPAGGDAGDQARTATPAAAIAAGAHYLVVGRPIIAARDPAVAARALIEEISA